MRYKIPKKALQIFTDVAKENKSNINHKHIETLAYLLGYEDKCNDTIIATEIVFPNQVGTAILVTDEGKYTFEMEIDPTIAWWGVL